MFLSKIKKRDGRIADFAPDRIKNAVHKAFLAVELGNGEKAKNVTAEVVKRLDAKFKEKTPSVEDVQDLVVEVLEEKGYEKVAQEYQDYRKKKEELRALREKLGIEPKLTVNSLEVLKARYLLRDEKKNIIETPTRLFKRVAKAIAKVDKTFGENPEKSEKTFYQMMAKLDFLPNTPTLFNAGTDIGQLPACFVLPVEDSLESIFSTVKNMALIEQTGGGVGFDFSHLRPKGDIVRSTKGIASGPLSFMRVFDVSTEIIKAGGKRRGAMMAILRVDHPDILDFITSKKKPGFLSNFNISAAATDEFMKAVETDSEYWLVNPRNKEKTSKLIAKDVWNLMARSAWQSGDPGVVFIDEINRHNPTPEVGRIESTNPCVTDDAWVMTKDGPRQVKELRNKMFLAIVNGEEWKSTKEGFFETGRKPVYELRTKEGFELRLTGDHNVMAVKKFARWRIVTEWKNAKSLEAGGKVVLNDHQNMSWKGRYTEKEGYLIGLLIGDGTIKQDKTILSSWGEDAGAKAVRKLVLEYAEELPHRSDFTGWMKIENRNEYRLSTGYLKKLAEKLGIGSGKKTITPEMENASSDFCRGLLRGLFDADGSVQGNRSKGFSVRLSQSDVNLLKIAQRMLLRLGILAKIYVNRRKEGFSRLPAGKGKAKNYPRKANHELVISKENMLCFRNQIGLGDSDKALRLERILKGYKRKMNRERFVATVSSLTLGATEKVYDASIPSINAFDANGFHVHNCGEQPLLPYESCNLGSINLSRMVEVGKIDWDKLKAAVRNAVQFLDDVIDANKYPLLETDKITRANRKIGLGVMGFAGMLIKLRVPYDSERALSGGEQVMEVF